MGLALAATDKAVQLYYEYSLRPADCRLPSWIERCQEQLAAALSALENHAAIAIPHGRLNQAQLTAAVGLRFMQHVQKDLPSALAESGRYPRLEALSAYCENLPEFQLTPLE